MFPPQNKNQRPFIFWPSVWRAAGQKSCEAHKCSIVWPDCVVLSFLCVVVSLVGEPAVGFESVSCPPCVSQSVCVHADTTPAAADTTTENSATTHLSPQSHLEPSSETQIKDKTSLPSDIMCVRACVYLYHVAVVHFFWLTFDCFVLTFYNFTQLLSLQPHTHTIKQKACW